MSELAQIRLYQERLSTTMHTFNLKARELEALALSTPLDKLFCLLLTKEFIVSATIRFLLDQRLYIRSLIHFNLFKSEYIN